MRKRLENGCLVRELDGKSRMTPNRRLGRKRRIGNFEVGRRTIKGQLPLKRTDGVGESERLYGPERRNPSWMKSSDLVDSANKLTTYVSSKLEDVSWNSHEIPVQSGCAPSSWDNAVERSEQVVERVITLEVLNRSSKGEVCVSISCEPKFKY
jgi:hypothetical protein